MDLSPPNLAFQGNRIDVLSVLSSDPLFHPLNNSTVKNCLTVLNIFSNSQLFQRQKHQCWLEFGTTWFGCGSIITTPWDVKTVWESTYVYQGDASTFPRIPAYITSKCLWTVHKTSHQCRLYWLAVLDQHRAVHDFSEDCIFCFYLLVSLVCTRVTKTAE